MIQMCLCLCCDATPLLERVTVVAGVAEETFGGDDEDVMGSAMIGVLL
jgi:hypothetical protein